MKNVVFLYAHVCLFGLPFLSALLLFFCLALEHMLVCNLNLDDSFVACWSLPPLLYLLCVFFSTRRWDVSTGVGSIRKELVKGNGASGFAAGRPSSQHVILPHIWLPVGGISFRVASSPCRIGMIMYERKVWKRFVVKKKQKKKQWKSSEMILKR